MSRIGRFRANLEDISEPPINLTPLIDVVFVILIIFIVIAPLLELDSIALADAGRAGEKACLSVEACSPISIEVRADNSVWLNGRQATLATIEQQLKEAKRQFPNAEPQLFHDKRALFGTYQSIKNAAEMAGFKKIDIILKP
ncbi:MAG: ExbD/TolR family protein [Parachlamydiaceae bacterium]